MILSNFISIWLLGINLLAVAGESPCVPSPNWLSKKLSDITFKLKEWRGDATLKVSRETEGQLKLAEGPYRMSARILWPPELAGFGENRVLTLMSKNEKFIYTGTLDNYDPIAGILKLKQTNGQIITLSVGRLNLSKTRIGKVPKQYINLFPGQVVRMKLPCRFDDYYGFVEQRIEGFNDKGEIIFKAAGKSESEPILNFEAPGRKQKIQLIGADFTDENLSYTYLNNMDLRGAKFGSRPAAGMSDWGDRFVSDLYLDGTDLRGADLSKLDPEYIERKSLHIHGATYDESTKFPKDFDPKQFEMKFIPSQQ